jgi:enamine deaminase RidA (YjgF/YER057c/UK114 family)
MSRQSVLVVMLAAGLLAAAQGAAAQMQRVAIVDPSGFEKPMPAHWVQLPAGWRTQGGPVRSTMQVTALANPGFLVEIEVTAVLP